MKRKYAEYNDSELIKLLKGKRKDAAAALEEIYIRYSDKIFTFCIKFLNDRDIALDIFHDSFIKFYDAVKSGVEVSHIGAYITKIARNECLNENKKIKNSEYHENYLNDYTYEIHFENTEMKELLDYALQALPNEYKEIVILKEFLDFKYREIAELLEINLSIVQTRIHRAKKLLRDYLKAYKDEIKEI